MSSQMSDMAARYLRMPADALGDEERRVLSAVMERRHVSRPVHDEMEARAGLGQRVADRIAGFGGSWPFIGLFFLFLGIWIALNAYVLRSGFDPFPFILLNLILSCVSAIQAPLILMSQNRQGEKDREQAAHDYEVNLKAELEILQLHERIDAVRAQELTRIIELQERQIRMLEALVAKRASPL